MRAYVLERYGGSDAARLREHADPTAAAGQLRIRVQAAGLNPVDYKIRAGKLLVINRYPLPQVLGSELAGVVDELGAGVQGFELGQRVYARVAKEQLGAFAEMACVDARLVASMPDSLGFEQAAAVPLAALTALQCLRDELQVGPGMRLLITGGAGGVGSFAIPLAKHLGARVSTTASIRGAALVRQWGADEVIDYEQADWAAHARTFDGALDLVGSSSLFHAIGAVRRGGCVVSIAGAPEPRTAWFDLDRNLFLAALFVLTGAVPLALAALHGVRYRYKFMHPSSADLQWLSRLIDAGTLPVRIDRIVPFAQIASAFEYLEAGRAKGKVVVSMAAAL